LTLGAALGVLFLTRGWLGAAPVMLAVLCCFSPHGPLWHKKKWLLPAAALAALICLAWWLPVRHYSGYWAHQWWSWQHHQLDWPTQQNLFDMVRDLPWFLWPTWPFALLALW